jgi:MerR family transcriptional regulator, light-induced transcriptional regulator
VSDADLTLHEAAESLGVHYMTAYRYVRLGLLPATKVGGSWQVAAADVHDFKHVAPVVSDEPGSRRRAPWASRLEARLIAGDGRGAWGVVEAALAAGTELDEIYLDLISPAMRNIGARWAAGEIDISVEHRATGIAFRLIGRLGPRFARRGRTRGTVLLGTPEGERHSLPVAMLADLVRGGGWEVSDIGADLPAQSFVSAALDTSDLVAVGVSVTSPDNLPAAAEVVAALRESVGHVYVAVGGGAVADEAHALALGAHGWAASASDFTAQLRERGTPGTRIG